MASLRQSLVHPLPLLLLILLLDLTPFAEPFEVEYPERDNEKPIPAVIRNVPEKKHTVPQGIFSPAPPKRQPTRFQNVTGNSIDDCWISDSSWATRRQNLASCARGYGKDAEGGLGGRIYTVTTNADDPVNPVPGSLRYGVTRVERLWIVFERDMVFKLTSEIIVGNYKTIDARGAKITFQDSTCFFLKDVHNVIIHGINFIRCARRTRRQAIRISPTRVRESDESTGDAITLEGSSAIWIDHCSFDSIQYKSDDKHIVVKLTSSYVTISNSKFQNMDKVILLGHDDSWREDKRMRVTVALNYFGRNLVQRLPRCRFGNFHVVNNYYPDGWGAYAIGGSARPTILAEANYFVAKSEKEVTDRIVPKGVDTSGWNWRGIDNAFFNGAFFRQSGSVLDVPYGYKTIPASSVPTATSKAGPLECDSGKRCL